MISTKIQYQAKAALSPIRSSFTTIKNRQLQRSSTTLKTPNLDGVPPVVHEVLRSQGEPLDRETRTFMELRFGHDFSRVRVHTDARAVESARAVNALAYTIGQNIVFGEGQYLPSTNSGQRLLAHELAHTIQQGRAIPHNRNKPGITHPDSPTEREAEAASGPAVANQAGLLKMKEDVSLARFPDASDAGTQNAGTTDTGKYDAGTPGAGTTDAGKQDTDASDAGTTKEKETKPAAKSSKTICLTFDDGPQKGTEDVLDELGGTIPATFFLTGKNMRSDPAMQKNLVERMLNEGHQIGNHTFTHDPTTEEGYKKTYGDLSNPENLKKFQENYEKNEQHFQTLLGTTSPVFTLARLPGQGRFIKSQGKLIFVVATEGMGMAHVTWNFEFGTKGSFPHLKAKWQNLEGVVSERNVLPKPNNIILFHDRHWSGKEALFKSILQKLETNGFVFGKLDESGKCK